MPAGNGAGLACTDTTTCSTGGGASDVRRNGVALANRIIVAAGAGGVEWNGCLTLGGGHGGGTVGGTGTGNGSTSSGTGGTQAAGGAAGTDPCGQGGMTAGGLGVGGTSQISLHSGSGGGGYYGGGGGGCDGSGGGGSSFLGGMTSATLTVAGVRSGNGQVIVRFP